MNFLQFYIKIQKRQQKNKQTQFSISKVEQVQNKQIQKTQHIFIQQILSDCINTSQELIETVFISVYSLIYITALYNNKSSSVSDDPLLMQQFFIQFHLNDQQPESINAKRKLEQFSIQIQQKHNLNPQKKNQNTIELLMKNQKKLHQIHNYHHNQLISNNANFNNSGWDNVLEIGDQYSNMLGKNNKNRLITADKNKKNNPIIMRETLKYKSWAEFNKNQKKYSLDVSKFNQTNKIKQKQKINLSFNNLIAYQAQSIRQNEINQQISKRAKTQHEKRPSTATYYQASKKIIALFDNHKNSTTINTSLNNQTIRIHSTKQLKNSKDKKNIPITYKDKDNFLKTTSYFNYHQNHINKVRKESKSEIQSKNMTHASFNILNYVKELDQENVQADQQEEYTQKKSNFHRRNISQPTEGTPDNNFLSQQNYNTLANSNRKPSQQQPFRKNIYLGQKKAMLLNKKIKSHHLFVPTNNKNENNIDYQDENIGKENVITVESNRQVNDKQNQNSEEQCSKQNKCKRASHSLDSIQNMQASNRSEKNSLIKRQKTIKHSQPQQSISSPVPIPSSNFLQQDFSLLISMLKQQSQSVINGNLHNYLTQMKNNQQYNYYHTNPININRNSTKRTKVNTNKLTSTNNSSQNTAYNYQKGNSSQIKNYQSYVNNTVIDSNNFSDEKRNQKINNSVGQIVDRRSRVKMYSGSSGITSPSILKTNKTLHYQAFSSMKNKQKESKGPVLMQTMQT